MVPKVSNKYTKYLLIHIYIFVIFINIYLFFNFNTNVIDFINLYLHQIPSG